MNPCCSPPSARIEQVWQAHLLSTVSYRDACTVLGAVIHHSHAGVKDGEMVKRKRIDLTKSFYLTVFKCSPPSQFWVADYFEKKTFCEKEVEETNFENSDVDDEDIIHVFDGDHNADFTSRGGIIPRCHPEE